MAFPTNWPPRPASANRSLRAFKSGTTSGDFADNAYIFKDLPGANTYTTIPTIQRGDTTTVVSLGYMSPGSSNADQICAGNIMIKNDSANDIEISFDGVEIHGVVKNGELLTFRDRREAGIALRFPAAGSASNFRVWAW